MSLEWYNLTNKPYQIPQSFKFGSRQKFYTEPVASVLNQYARSQLSELSRQLDRFSKASPKIKYP